MISSETNGQMKDLVKLQKQARFRRKNKEFVVEGSKMLLEAAKHGKLKRFYLSETLEATGVSKELQELMKDYPYEIVTDSVFDKVSDTVTPQGMMGVVEMPQYSLQEIFEAKEKKYILLDDLRDPGNLGTIMRTAEGAGMSAVIMSKESVDLFNPKVVRSTMGAIFRMPFCYVEDLSETIATIQNKGICVYATAMEGSVNYTEPDYGQGAGFVIGNEANGVSQAVFKAAKGRIFIPMKGELESLNAAVSGAIVMYEMARQCAK